MVETMNAIVGFLRERGFTVEYWAPEPTRTIDIRKDLTLTGTTMRQRCRAFFEPDDVSFRVCNLSHSTHFTIINIVDPNFFDKLLAAIERWAEPN